MQSLGVSQDYAIADAARQVRERASRTFVAPRFLRRPLRLLQRAEWRLPRLAGAKALIALFVATAIAGMVMGGHVMTVASAVTAWVGFGIENVKISGQSQTSEVDVLAALDIGTYPSLLTLDVEAAKARIEALPWVKQATLRKLYPDAVEIELVEREPFAIWEHDDVAALVDRTGRVITESVADRYASLPRVVGEGASPRAAEYTDLIAGYPNIAGRTKAGILVSGRRWNLILDNGIEVMLPEEHPEAALAILDTLESDHKLLEREIAAVDLRVKGSLVVRLTPEGFAQRQAQLKQTAKRGGSVH